MIDTIKISHFLLQMPCPDELQQRGWRERYNETTGRLTSRFYKEEGNRNPYLSLFTAKDSKVYLSATVSLPAFIFGSNLTLPDQAEIEQGLNRLSEYISEKSGIDFNAQTAMVWKVHFTKDYLVREFMMRRIISKLSEMSVPRFDRGRYSDTTLYFHSKGSGKQENKPRTICIYDKHQERIKKSSSQNDIRQSEGMLRLEFRYKTPAAVRRLIKGLGLPNREAKTVLTKTVSEITLAPIEKQILLLLKETNVQHKIIKLTQTFGKRRTGTLIQFLNNKQFFGNDFYKIKSLEFSRSAYYDCQKDCREVGILNLFDTSEIKI